MKSEIKIQPQDEGHNVFRLNVELTNGLRLEIAVLISLSADILTVAEIINEKLQDLLDHVEKNIGYTKEEIIKMYPKN